MFKKMTVLAMAVGVVAALALPASASASWKHHDTPIGNDVDIDFTGNVRFQGKLGGVECQITSTATFLAGQTTGKADTFKPHPGTDTENCKGLSGLAACQIHNLTPQAPEWTFHTQAFQTVTAVHNNGNGQFQTTFGEQTARAAVVTTQTITSQLTGGIFCLVKHISLHAGNVGIVEDNEGGPKADGKTIKNVEVNGALTATLQTNGGAVHDEEVLVTGTLGIEDPLDRNTYSF